MLHGGLLISRFLFYVAITTMFGAAFFPLYAGKPQNALTIVTKCCASIVVVSAIGVIVSSFFLLAFTTASMTGNVSDATDPAKVWVVLSETAFGQLWLARSGLTVLLLLIAWAGLHRTTHRKSRVVIAALAGIVLASLAGTGHAQAEQPTSYLHMGADAAHLLAAGAWLGGLVGLADALRRQDHDSLEKTLRHFSAMGYAAVGVLIASGVINSWYLVGSISHLTTDFYGQVLLIKIAMFATMLALAGLNRFWLVPQLARSRELGAARALAQLRRHVLLEQLLGLLVLLAVAYLGTMDPAA